MSDEPPIRVLIVDDEAPARRRLAGLIETHSKAHVLDEANEGEEAVEKIRVLEPDLVFLDVQMSDISGLEVIRRVGPDEMPPVIFVTAYDEYAIEAFELTALDDILKPFDNERFQTALERARSAIQRQEIDQLRRRLSDLLEKYERQKRDAEASPSEATREEYLDRIAVQKRGRIRVIKVDEIDYVEASGAYAELHVGEETHLIRERMKTLDGRLDPSEFMRVHRSYIVKIDRIESLLVNEGGNYALRLRDGSSVKVSRDRRKDLERRLGLEL